MQKLKVFVFSAHADDLEVHASALVLQLLDAGHDVTSFVTTFGLRDGKIGDRSARDVRIEESHAAHAILGLKPNFEHARYEQELNVDPSTRAEFKKLILDVKPDIVITHWPIDANPDHRATAILTMEPCYQLATNTEILYYEAISSGRSAIETRPQTMCFIPTHYCQTMLQLDERKRELTMCHQSQDPVKMFAGQIRLQQCRGLESGLNSAEAWIAGKRVGGILPELLPFITPTRWNLPDSIGTPFDPETIGIKA